VIDRLLADVADEMNLFFEPGRWDGRPIADILGGYLRGVMGLDRGRPGFRRIGQEASVADQETRDRYRATRKQVNVGLRRLLAERRDQVGHPEPDQAIALVIDQVTAMINSRLERNSTPTELGRVSDEQFITLVLESSLSFLRYSTD